jgi:hypothetical protein
LFFSTFPNLCVNLFFFAKKKSEDAQREFAEEGKDLVDGTDEDEGPEPASRESVARLNRMIDVSTRLCAWGLQMKQSTINFAPFHATCRCLYKKNIIYIHVFVSGFLRFIQKLEQVI